MVRLPEVQPASKRRWTAADLDTFSESFTNSARYEVLLGALLVTPAPAPRHAILVAQLVSALSAYCRQHDAGVVCAPGVVRWDDNQLEPDIAVYPPHTPAHLSWAQFPLPLLVIEVHSPSTAHIDRTAKRDAYRALGIPEYWQVVPDEAAVLVTSPSATDRVVRDTLSWAPSHTLAHTPLTLPVAPLFG